MEESTGVNKGAGLVNKKPTAAGSEAETCSPISHLCPSSLQVIDGKLAPFLSKVIKFASAHVFSCSLCREKGFICELCRNGQIIYPFQESSITRYSFPQISTFYSVPY